MEGRTRGQETLHRAGRDAQSPCWLGSYDAYGVAANELPTETIFAEYERCGFLYPAKRARLAPVMDRVLDTWHRSTTAAARERWVHHTLSHSASPSSFATISVWRSGTRRVHSQHLVARGTARGSRLVMLAAQDVVAANEIDYAENWFRTENRFPARVFGGTPHALGPERAALEPRRLVVVGAIDDPGKGVEPVRDDAAPAARALLERLAGSVLAAAEELDTGDVELRELDEAYRSVGLSRRRDVFMACGRTPVGRRPVGLACAYRGPVGLNFSLLENKVDLWLDPDLPEAERQRVALALIAAAQGASRDQGPIDTLVACDPVTGRALEAAGAGRFVRDYVRCVWTRAGFWDWYRHVDGFYARVLERERRHAARQAGSVEGSG